jgi:uncharacterized protein (DUF4415 family)
MSAKRPGSKRAWVDPITRQNGRTNSERAEIAIGGHVLRPSQGTLTRPRGRPKKPDAKVRTHIRLSPQVLEYFRATGPGWQARIGEVLRTWVSRRRGGVRPLRNHKPAA